MALALLAALGCDRATPPSSATGPDQPQRLATATIRVGSTPLVVEVARTREEQRKGMMFRKHLRPDEAMLFIADRDTNLSFWMKNTSVGLDLAYIRSDGVIVQIERMNALDTEPVFAREPARFTLEVPAGWFAAHGVGVGAKVEIPPEVVNPVVPRP
ncbi:MAG: DUF192 domain-containing protein [Planctomycetota bacterium]|nr:DUF192 domain-containing protein [Planctomycetota bacterium]